MRERSALKRACCRSIYVDFGSEHVRLLSSVSVGEAWKWKSSITLGHSLVDACVWNSHGVAVCCRNDKHPSTGRFSRIISDYAREKFVSSPPYLRSEQLRWLRMWRMTQIKSARSEQPFRTSQTLETDSNRICNAKWESEQTLLITNEVRNFFLSSSPLPVDQNGRKKTTGAKHFFSLSARAPPPASPAATEWL